MNLDLGAYFYALFPPSLLSIAAGRALLMSSLAWGRMSSQCGLSSKAFGASRCFSLRTFQLESISSSLAEDLENCLVLEVGLMRFRLGAYAFDADDVGGLG